MHIWHLSKLILNYSDSSSLDTTMQIGSSINHLKSNSVDLKKPQTTHKEYGIF